MIGEHRWAFSFIGSTILIFAIHFSQPLRRLFSHRYAVFFGSISFPVYLIHSFVMRSVLVWVIYGIVPQGPVVVRLVLNSIAFLGYLGLVIWLSLLWKENVDVWCASFAQGVEDIVLGNQSMMETLSSFRIGITSKEGDIELESGLTSVLKG